jgi:uncharacterized protein (DUF983 family)
MEQTKPEETKAKPKADKWHYYWCPNCGEAHTYDETKGDDECPTCGRDMELRNMED